MTKYNLKKMGKEETIKYVNSLNKSSLKIHGKIGTICNSQGIEKVIKQFGEFVLGIIPKKILPYHPNPLRKPKIEKLFTKPINLNNIPPILVRSYNPSSNRDNMLELFDGQTRAGVAYEKKVPLLAYVPKKITKNIPGFKKI